MNLAHDSVSHGTKLDSVKVDPRLRVRDTSGLDFIDHVLSGDSVNGKRGFTPSTAWLFTGTPGAGKTTLVLQLADSLAKEGHFVLYNTGEESLAQVKMCAERLRLEGQFNVGADIFVDAPEGKAGEKITQTLRQHIMSMVAEAKKANSNQKDINKQRRVYVLLDSLQCMNDGKWGFKSNSRTPVRVLEELIAICKEHYVTLMVIAQVTKSGEFKGDNTLLHMVDGHMHLLIDQDPKSMTEGKRLLECRKNRFGPTGIAIALDIAKDGLSELNKRTDGSYISRKV